MGWVVLSRTEGRKEGTLPPPPPHSSSFQIPQTTAPHREPPPLVAAMAAGSKERRNPATCLTDDLIVEILSRLPVKSLCRFKCVSKHWLGLISHPDHRKKLPQTLTGFFYQNYGRERSPELALHLTNVHFTNITGRGAHVIRPSLSFLPGDVDITILNCCNGLLLCEYRMTADIMRYIVCNPATEEWTALPESSPAGSASGARLGFDPTASPHFHVFEFVEADDEPPDDLFIGGVEIYSSKTGEWVHRDSGWSGNEILCDDMSTVFLNGFLHLFASTYCEYVLVVDTEGKAWRTIPVPEADGNDDEGFIGQSQGHLYYLNTVEGHGGLAFNLKIYVLEDYGTSDWIFKHSVSTAKLLDMHGVDAFACYSLIAVHPECNLIFFISDLDHTIRCYDMKRGEVNVICHIGCKLEVLKCCLAYVPLFSESSGWR